MERFAIKIDKSLRANLYKICRLCGIDNPDKIKVRDDANIVNLEDGEPELWKKVFDCIGLLITKDDKMPQFMCTLCVDKINDFFEFREMCYATDGQTRKLLGIKGEPKSKVQAIDPSSSIDFKFEDYKEPFLEVTPQRAGRKRRNADMEITKDIKLDIGDDIKPSTTNIASSVTKKKRLKLSNTVETETKIEPGTKSAKKEPALKITPKAEPLSKIPLSKKRLKAEPIVKENKKEAKSAKLTKLMKKKLKIESTSDVLPEPTKKKKVELIKMKKLPQVVVKAEKLKKGVLDTKIKEETPVAILSSDPSPVPAGSSKVKPKCKEKCTICDEGFINKVHLDKHVKTTHIPTIQRYHCVQCNETLKKNMEIKNHNLWHKLSKTPFKCGKCSESSCSIYTYSKHIRDCNPIAYLDSHIPDWHCPDCSGNYETTYLFNIHSCVAKGLVCPGCETSLKWKEDYFKHIPTCSEAFQRIPPYMTSNIQVKNEAELPTSPIPPLSAIALPATTITSVTVQSTSSTRVTPPQMDSNQCVVIPGNISLHEDAGSASPSKSSRKGKRITKKDLKRFDKLLKSTMTTLVSIKHEPQQGEDPSLADDSKPSSSEVKEQSEPPSSPLESPPGSPIACGGDDFHHNGDDSDSADEQIPDKPVGTIKQEIIDEGYRDLYNNIEVNIKHEIDANKNTAEESLHKKTAESMNAPEESSLAPKPILKLKITKEHGTLNSVLMDSPKSEKKKKKKKRKEDRNKSPEKEERSVAIDTPAPPTADVMVNNEVPVEAGVSVDIDVAINQTSALESNKPVVSDIVEEPSMPLPEIINIKKEINIPDEHEAEEEAEVEAEAEASSLNTPSIVAASSGSLQISCVSEGVIFNRSDENEEAMPQDAPYSASEQANLTSEEPANWEDPIPSMELSLSSRELASPPVEDATSMQYPMTQETEEEIDIKPRLEDLVPMLQIASVTSGAEVVDKPIRKPVKRKRRQATAKSDAVPKIVSVSSGNEVASYHHQSDVSSLEGEDSNKNIAERNQNDFDFSQVSIKEEIVDPAYEEGDEEEVEADKEETGDDEEEEKEDEEQTEEEKEVEADVQTTPVISNKQAEENAYIANIDFNNLTIKEEKEYIDDGLENSAYEVGEDDDGDGDEEEENEDEEVEDECSDDSDEDSSDDDSNKSDSESEREYRELPSDDEETDKNDEQLPVVPSQMAPIMAAIEKETPTSQTQFGLQILAVHSEFICPQSSKKTESEKLSSDDKLSLNSTTEQERETEKKVSNLNLNLKSNTSVKKTDNCSEDHENLLEVNSEIRTESNYGKPMLENMDTFEEATQKQIIESSSIDGASMELRTCEIEKTSIIDGISLQPIQIAETDNKLTRDGSTEEASISRTNSIDHCGSAETNPESRKSAININKVSLISREANLESTNLAKVCDDLANKANEQIQHNPSSLNEEQNMSVDIPSQEASTTLDRIKIGMADDLNRGLHPGNASVGSTSSLLQRGGISCTNTDIRSVSTPQATSGVDMVPMDQCYDTALRSIDKASRLCVEAFEEVAHRNVTGRQDTAQKGMLVHTEDDGMLPNSTDLSRARLTSQSLAHEPSPVRLVDTIASCPPPAAVNLSELHPVNDVQQNSPVISTSVQSLLGSHLPSTHNSAISYSTDDHIRYKDNNHPMAMGLPPTHSQNTPPTNLSVPANHTPNAFESTNTLLNLGHAVGNSISSMDPPYNHDRRDLNPSESVFNIPPSRMEFQQFSAPGSSYAPYNCNSDQVSFTDFLTPPTAGQLQTSLVQQPVVNESPELSSNSLTNLSVLSEEVQNLLNEDTVAINNFEFNDNVLRARVSAAPNNPAPIFNDFENLNEIAENNNNANIERELQDELGNVLADAIADRSNDDDVDDNNVMNENRANFDIT